MVAFIRPGEAEANFVTCVEKLRRSMIRRVLLVHHLALNATILTGVGAGILEVRIAAHYNAVTRDSDTGSDGIYAIERFHFNSVKSVRQHRSAPS